MSEIFCCGFSKISQFLERILIEQIELICSLQSRLTFLSICSIRIRSRNRDIFKKPLQLNSSPYVSIKRRNKNLNAEFLLKEAKDEVDGLNHDLLDFLTITRHFHVVSKFSVLKEKYLKFFRPLEING